jgi:histidinol phosphatase-like PHP family hydrolase
MGLADLHIHTIYSYDGTASIPSVLARARQIRLDVISITDHDEITGSKSSRAWASLWRRGYRWCGSDESNTRRVPHVIFFYQPLGLKTKA